MRRKRRICPGFKLVAYERPSEVIAKYQFEGRNVGTLSVREFREVLREELVALLLLRKQVR